MLTDRREEEICPSSHDSKLPAHDHQARIVACLDPATIGKGLGPWNLVVVHATAQTKLPPIGIKRVRWTAGTHALKTHRPYLYIDVWPQQNFVRFTQKQRITVQNDQDFMGVHCFNIGCRCYSVSRSVL